MHWGQESFSPLFQEVIVENFEDFQDTLFQSTKVLKPEHLLRFIMNWFLSFNFRQGWQPVRLMRSASMLVSRRSTATSGLETSLSLVRAMRRNWSQRGWGSTTRTPTSASGTLIPPSPRGWFEKLRSVHWLSSCLLAFLQSRISLKRPVFINTPSRFVKFFPMVFWDLCSNCKNRWWSPWISAVLCATYKWT